jgi:hypothetical protein
MNKALVRAFADLPNDHRVLIDESGLIHHRSCSPQCVVGLLTAATVAEAVVYGRTTCPYCWRRQP